MTTLTTTRQPWRRSLGWGLADYANYLACLPEHHPERAPPSYSEFFRERPAARYRGGGGRYC